MESLPLTEPVDTVPPEDVAADPFADVPPPEEYGYSAASSSGPQEGSTEGTVAALLVDGASFLLDIPEGIPAVWGTGDDVLWARGESCLLSGPTGVGKTTLLGLVLMALLGIGEPRVLGLPVVRARRVLYLAMDRPQQIARALSRRVRAEHRDTLAERLVVWKGPPPADLAKHPGMLAHLAEQAGADVVVIDSLKDAAIGLGDDEVGAGYNRARQLLLTNGVELAELHHVVKRGANGGPPTSLADVYGSAWLTAGAGSVLALAGEAGDPIVAFRHLKQPASEVGPWQLLHDQATGAMTVEHGIDLLALAGASGRGGLTAKHAAVAMVEKSEPTRAEVEKARRKLDRLVRSGHLRRDEGQTGPEGGKPTATWHPVESNHASNHGTLFGPSNHGGAEQSHSGPDPQVRAITDPITAVTQGGNHECTPLYTGGAREPEAPAPARWRVSGEPVTPPTEETIR